MRPEGAIPPLSLLIFLALSAGIVNAELPDRPANITVGVRLVNVEKVDLASNSYRLDFYLWFIFNHSEISLDEVREFEFLNGAPSKYEIYADEADGFLEYRVKGDFVKTFDFSHYPFETHRLVVEMEHKNLNSTYLICQPDPDSSLDEGVNVIGWDLVGFETAVVEHRFSGTSFSKFVFSLITRRPPLSSFIKSILPISIITTISLLTFFISPQNFSQRIALGVTTLMSASAFHLSLLSGLPPTGYLTLADRIMLSVYIVFLFNLSTSVYIMKLMDAKKAEEAIKTNKNAAKVLALLIIILTAMQFFI